jgi:mannose-6-phosphate isomerase-like protein (cupin superfamily)
MASPATGQPVHLVHADELSSEPLEGGYFRTLLSPALGGTLAVYLLTVTRSEPHVHATEDQVYIVRDGRGLLEVDGHRREVRPGHLVFIPRGHRHCLTALGDQPVTLYSLMHVVA